MASNLIFWSEPQTAFIWSDTERIMLLRLRQNY